MATGQVTKEIVTKSKLDNLANSISTKSGVSTPMTIDQMKVAVEGIISGTKGAIYQDEQGYLVVAKDADIPIQIDSLTVTLDGTYTAPANHAYNPVVVDTAVHPVRYVKFIDYDGTELYSYTHTLFNALSSMPANPTHTGLTAQGWNWTIADAKAHIAAQPNDNLIIGQHYVTTSGKTEIDILLDDEKFLKLYLRLCCKGAVVVDWGDNSELESISFSTSWHERKYIFHEYPSIGNYTISVLGSFALQGDSSYSLPLLCRSNAVNSNNRNQSRSYAAKVTHIRLGNQISTFDNGNYFFVNCSSLLDVTVPAQVKMGGSYCFAECYSLKSIVISNQSTDLYVSAFNDCYNLLKISISNTVSYIALSCFTDCYSLQQIAIPRGVTYIGLNAFRNCYLINNITIPKLTSTMGDMAFYYCTDLLNIDLFTDGSLTSINNSSFCLTNIEKIIIPNEVTYIQAGAFSGCYFLKLITLPNTVTSIGSQAFLLCYSLRLINIPNTVTSIGGYAFRQCYSLQLITIPNTVTSIGSYTFGYCHSLKLIVISNAITSIGDDAFVECNALLQIVLSNTVETIGNYAFSSCYSLKLITLPNTVTSIGAYAFSYCYSLREITIPNGITTIGNYTFSGCSSLRLIIIPSGVTSIGSNVFSYCYSLELITIPNTVTSIGGYAFQSCMSLQLITIPSSVTSIVNYAFSYCSGMKEYHLLPTTPPSIGSSTFYSIPSDCIIYVPQGCLSAYQSASNWSTYASKMQEEPT